MSKQKNKALIISRDTPAKSADEFRKTRPNLIRQQDEWLDYLNGAHYPVEDQSIKSEISAFLESAKSIAENSLTNKMILVPFNPKPRDVNTIYDMLANRVHKPKDTMAPPCWLDGRTDLDPKNIISCQNGLLDMTTRVLYPASPAFFTRTALPIDYTPDAPTPTLWLAFLAEVMVQRPALVRTIQEMTGYLISGDTSLHRVFFFHGKPRSGKGTIMRVLKALLGPLNVDYSTVETLSGRFGVQNLLGKSALFITDMNSANENIGRAASVINAISGEDDVTAERKGISSWVGKLSTRILMSANTLPRFGVHTAAMLTRLIVVPFDVSFAGHEDRQLTEKLLTELPGILNWALDGLDTLRMCGDFDEPEESLDEKARLENVSEPLLGFINEHCELRDGCEVDKDVLHSEYDKYVQINHLRPMSKNTFAERLLGLHKGIGRTRPRKGEERYQAFTGIRLVRRVAENELEIDKKTEAAVGLMKIDEGDFA